jgi:hypothetical protein
MMSWEDVSFGISVFLSTCSGLLTFPPADGFFDAGMLLQALKARGESLDSGETKPSERAAVQARRRDVGKKLRLIEY